MHRATNHFYDGIPYEDLVFTDVDWSQVEGTEHDPSRRRARGAGEDVLVEHATEACHDPRRLVGSAQSRSALTVAVVGYWRAAGRLLRVVLLGKDVPAGTDWWGASAWVANSTWRRRYDERTDE